MASGLTLPLFPLHTVLFPGGMLPLKIFEQRYLEMTKRCIRDGTPFGVCRILEGEEIGPPAAHALIGCSSSIVDWDMPHLGMFQLRARGEHRIQVLATRTHAGGLIEADVELLENDPGEIAAPHVDLCSRLLAAIVERIGSNWYFPPARYDLPEWVGHRLAEALPLSSDARQNLLELPDIGTRLSHLHELIVRSGMPPFAA